VSKVIDLFFFSDVTRGNLISLCFANRRKGIGAILSDEGFERNDKSRIG